MNFRLLKADEIECRVSTVSENGVSLLLYKDARVDQNILDETVGSERWQRKHEIIGGNLFCSVGILCDLGTYSEWVWKQDVGTESYTEKEKGQASDAFKRACFNWGIGRELYTAPRIRIYAEDVKLEEKNGKWTTYDRFNVSEIGYIGRKISTLVIKNKNKIVFSIKDDFIDAAKIQVLKADIKNGILKNENALFNSLGVNGYEEITETMFRYYVAEREKNDRDKR